MGCCQKSTATNNNDKLTLGHNNGLPNLGKTCYINTCLQLLFSIIDLRKILVIDQKIFNEICLKQDLEYDQLLEALFYIMINDSYDQEKKIKILKEIQQKLINQEGYNFKKNTQGDTSQVFSIIICDLIDKYDELTKMTERSFSRKCKCQQRYQHTNSIFQTMKLKCAKCKKEYKDIYVQPPKYFFVTAKGKQSVEKKLTVQSKQKKNVQYQLISCAVHGGNHYICYRKQNQNWFQISDNATINYGKYPKGKSFTLAIYKKNV